MMDSLFSTVVWCVVQVSLVSLSAVVISIIVARRNALLACSIVCIAAGVSALLTILAPLPIHRSFVIVAKTARNESKSTARLAGPTKTPVSEDVPSVEISDHSAFDLTSIAESLRTAVATTESLTVQNVQVTDTTTWMLSVVIAIGLARLAMGIAFIRKTCRRAVPVLDERLSKSVRHLAARLECRFVPEIRESSQFTDAAVAGLFRPVLILPCEWRQWDDDEREAVLAHEMAHIVRNDTLWRALASCVLAVHFFNPIIHWLLRRVSFYQELSADELAAIAIGPRSYLHSLSSLAIRQDDLHRRSVSPDLLPVFSGHLIKRIKVLLSMEGKMKMDCLPQRKWGSAVIATAFLAMAFATIATRGIAQSPNDGKKTPSSTIQTAVTPGTFQGSGSYSIHIQTTDPGPGMFARPPLETAALRKKGSEWGMVAVRVRELASRPEAQGYVPAINAVLSSWLASDLKSSSPPEMNCAAVEWVAARPTILFKGTKEDERGKLMFGAGSPTIKFSQPIDLKNWIERYAPQAKLHRMEGNDVFEVTLSVLGPAPVFLWMEDTTTLRINVIKMDVVSTTTLQQLFDSRQSPAVAAAEAAHEATHSGSPLAWTPAWNQVGGGLVAAVIAKIDSQGVEKEFELINDESDSLFKAYAKLYLALRSRCSMFAIGFDANETARVGFRVVLPHSNADDATQSADEIQQFVRLAKGELETRFKAALEVPGANSGLLKETHLLCNEALDNLTVTANQHDDGTSDIVISASVPSVKLIESIIRFSNEGIEPARKQNESQQVPASPK